MHENLISDFNMDEIVEDDFPFVISASESESDKHILLLGPSGSGKTTFLRQLRLNVKGGFSRQEKSIFLDIIRENIISFTQQVMQKVDFSKNRQLQSIVSQVMETEALNTDFSHKLVSDIQYLWSNPDMKQKSKSIGTDLFTNTPAFITRASIYTDCEYIPSDIEIAQARIRTTGYNHSCFKYESSLSIRFFDVGGARSERFKWKSIYPNAKLVLFFFSLYDFDHVMFEDENTTRIDDAKALFVETINDESLSGCDFHLVFTHYDRFEQRILFSDDFTKFFTNYTGNPKDPKECFSHIMNIFASITTKGFIFSTTNLLDAMDVQDLATKAAEMVK